VSRTKSYSTAACGFRFDGAWEEKKLIHRNEIDDEIELKPNEIELEIELIHE
jgi:hypothetical protein